ncbi:MAG: ruvB 3 [Chthoniobacteraceae bacterium]|nr:ruvB 3 [Chthoniobacteraceae bacterium]
MTDPAKSLAAAREALHGELRKCIIGQQNAAELLFITLLCGGHALLLGVPGVGKTLLAATLARALRLEFRRIQFTPDLMPADITGTEVLEEDPTTGRHKRVVMTGPLFTNVLLADEINRTPPKTQAALLQAMQEGEITIGCETHRLSAPFLVLATQNPIEMEGTYPLPEAQLDRFLCCIRIGYPTQEEELTIATTGPAGALSSVEAVLNPEEILSLQRAVRAVPIANDVAAYAVRLVAATRPGCKNGAPPGVAEFIDCGASPRASQALIATAKARALLNGRIHVDFADIRALAPDILRHRLVLNFRARAEKLDSDMLVHRVLDHVKTDAA